MHPNLRIGGITREQQLVLGVKQADTAGGVSDCLDDFQLLAAKVKHMAVFNLNEFALAAVTFGRFHVPLVDVNLAELLIAAGMVWMCVSIDHDQRELGDGAYKLRIDVLRVPGIDQQGLFRAYHQVQIEPSPCWPRWE